MAKAQDQGFVRRARGPERAGALLSSRIRAAGESRGFAVTRLLTHWDEIAGPEIAAAARPVEVTYGRGLGATLTLLTTGARAPMLEMQKETLREKVNACYGYSAISRIRITQTAPQGFAEPAAQFDHKPAELPPEVSDKAHRAVEAVQDETLRQALEVMGRKILSARQR